MYQDYKDLLSAFHAHGVKYLIVGGLRRYLSCSAPLYEGSRPVFIKADRCQCADATYAALADFGAAASRRSLVEDFTDRKSFFRFGSEPRGFDILPELPGIDFDDAWERRVEDVIDSESGLRANFISAQDLITAKRASGRLQDLADAEAVEQAQRLKPKTGPQ